MATITSVFQDALAEQAKSALADIVTRQPRTSVADLAELIASNPTLGSITLNELLKGISGASAAAPVAAAAAVAVAAAPVAKRRGRPPGRKTNVPSAPAVAAPAAPGAAAAAPAAPAFTPKRRIVSSGGAASANVGAGKRNVRTETGREYFDEEVLATLRQTGGDTVAATTLREMIGADPTQLRTALNRLIERGLVTFTGKARGTRYSLA